MNPHWLRDALRASGAAGVNISLEPGGIAVSLGGEYVLRTWYELGEAKSDPLTPTVEAVRRRVERKRANG